MINDVNNAKLYLLHSITTYRQKTAKGDAHKIKEIMRKFEYDDDLLNDINDDFCMEWEGARDIILKMLSDMCY